MWVSVNRDTFKEVTVEGYGTHGVLSLFTLINAPVTLCLTV